MIQRLENGRYHVTWNGQLSAHASSTAAKAEAYLAKLQKGLVRFEAYQTQAHQPAFRSGFCTGATRQHTLKPN